MGASSGGKLTQVFRVKSDMSKIYSGYDGTTKASNPEDAAFIIGGDVGNDILVQTPITYDAAGIPSIKFAQLKQGKAFDDFNNCFFPRKAGSSSATTLETVVSQSGKSIGGGAASVDQQLALLLVYGPLDDDGDIEVKAMVGYFSKTSGGKTYVNAKFVAPNIDFTAIACLTVTAVAGSNPAVGLIIPKVLFDTDIVTVPEDNVELQPDYYEVNTYLDPGGVII